MFSEARSGLNSEEVKRRLKEIGPNLLISEADHPLWRDLAHILRDPMGLMLLALAGVYAWTGQNRDAVVLLVAFVPLAFMDVILNLRTDRALRALKAMVQMHCFVLRDGRMIRVASRDLVPGDILVFEEGLVLPADGRVVSAEGLEVNEAPLTGESIPIPKSVESEFFAGTHVLAGRGYGEIESTGARTRFGQTAATLGAMEREASPLQRDMHRLVRWLFLLAILSAVGILLLEVARGRGWAEALTVSLTLAMAGVPEEFPLVYGLLLSLAAFRLSRRSVLVRSMPAVETLGRVDVLCTDKTGTLTEGRFTLQEVRDYGSPSRDELELAFRASCEPQITDTLERSMAEYAARHFSLNEMTGWTLITDYPFDSERKVMSHVWRNADGREIIAMKGAWEGVKLSCSGTREELDTIDRDVRAAADRGYRVLALAAGFGARRGPRADDERDLQPLAILMFADPMRASVPSAVRICQQNGIQIKLMSGDHLLTTHAVAERAGIEHDHNLIFTGEQLDKMAQPERENAYLKGAIFARVSAENKLQLVQALKKNGRTVAVTGDGINDLTALKAADVGVSMGPTATTAARETAQVILFKEDFARLVDGVMEGRRVFQSLGRSFCYLTAFHVPIILLVIAGPIAGREPVWLPIHLVLFEFLVHPLSAYGFVLSPSEKVVPAFKNRSLFAGRELGFSLFAGLLLSGACGLAAMRGGRSLAVLTFLLGNIAIVAILLRLEMRSNWKKFLIIAFALLGVTGALFGFADLRAWFRVDVLSMQDWVFAALTAGVYYALMWLFQKIKPTRNTLTR